MDDIRKQKYEILKEFKEQVSKINKHKKKLRIIVLLMTLITLLTMLILSGAINITIIPFMTLTTIIELFAINDYTESQIYNYKKMKDEKLKILNEQSVEKKEEKELTLNNYYHNEKTKEKVKIKK